MIFPKAHVSKENKSVETRYVPGKKKRKKEERCFMGYYEQDNYDALLLLR